MPYTTQSSTGEFAVRRAAGKGSGKKAEGRGAPNQDTTGGRELPHQFNRGNEAAPANTRLFRLMTTHTTHMITCKDCQCFSLQLLSSTGFGCGSNGPGHV